MRLGALLAAAAVACGLVAPPAHAAPFAVVLTGEIRYRTATTCTFQYCGEGHFEATGSVTGPVDVVFDGVVESGGLTCVVTSLVTGAMSGALDGDLALAGRGPTIEVWVDHGTHPEAGGVGVRTMPELAYPGPCDGSWVTAQVAMVLREPH